MYSLLLYSEVMDMTMAVPGERKTQISFLFAVLFLYYIQAILVFFWFFK